MNVGTRLAEVRKKLGLSQAELADLVGVSLRSQKRYESGGRIPDATYLERLRSAGGDVAYVLSGEGVPTETKRYSLMDGNPDADLLARVLAALDGEIERGRLVVNSEKKARSAVTLYRASRRTGVIDPQLVEQVALLAAECRLPSKGPQ